MARATNFIKTYTGKRVYPLEFEARDVDIHDIAHSLSQQCRFTGHTKDFYSVGDHSLRCAMAARAMNLPSWVQLQVLLHDASEAYLVDLPRPIKHSTTGDWAMLGRMFQDVEASIQSAIYRKFKLPEQDYWAVKEIDLRMLVTEQRDLMGHTPLSGIKGDSLSKIKPYDKPIVPIPSMKSVEKTFLSWVTRLTTERVVKLT